MQKPDRPKRSFFAAVAENLAWIFAIIFPKKGKPLPKTNAEQASIKPNKNK